MGSRAGCVGGNSGDSEWGVLSTWDLAPINHSSPISMTARLVVWGSFHRKTEFYSLEEKKKRERENADSAELLSFLRWGN